jgi:feruloyl-CoA synthase
VRRAFQEAFDALARAATGSSTFAARAVLLEEPPAIDAREVTDKGSLNQKAVLTHRAAIVEELYAQVPAAHIIVATT